MRLPYDGCEEVHDDIGSEIHLLDGEGSVCCQVGSVSASVAKVTCVECLRLAVSYRDKQLVTIVGAANLYEHRQLDEVLEGIVGLIAAGKTAEESRNEAVTQRGRLQRLVRGLAAVPGFPIVGDESYDDVIDKVLTLAAVSSLVVAATGGE